MEKSSGKFKGKSVADTIQEILQSSFVGGQEELRGELAKQGLDVNQSTISRVLKKLGAVRTYDANHSVTYVLPSVESLPSVDATIMDLVQGIVANEAMVVVSTKPGSASLIARHIDFHADHTIGTVAGDDCFFVVPKSTKKIKATLDELHHLLGWEE